MSTEQQVRDEVLQICAEIGQDSIKVARELLSLRAQQKQGPVAVVGTDASGVWRGGLVGSVVIPWEKKKDSTYVFLFKPLPLGTPLYAGPHPAAPEAAQDEEMVRVPRWPTDVMLKAAYSWQRNHSVSTCAEIYHAMLNAALSQQAAGTDGSKS